MIRKLNIDIILNQTMYMMFLFLAGSFLGWCMEVAFKFITTGDIINPGFLAGPYCPIYGFGIIIIKYLCNHSNKFIVFFKVYTFTTILEYVVSYILEKHFNLILWDYSSLPLHIGIRVSLVFSLIWGLIGIDVILWIEPFLKQFYLKYIIPIKKEVSLVLIFVIIDFFMKLL